MNKRMEDVGPNRGSWVFYPEELGKDGMLHPVFTWGPGAGRLPMARYAAAPRPRRPITKRA